MSPNYFLCTEAIGLLNKVQITPQDSEKSSATGRTDIQTDDMTAHSLLVLLLLLEFNVKFSALGTP